MPSFWPCFSFFFMDFLFSLFYFIKIVFTFFYHHFLLGVFLWTTASFRLCCYIWSMTTISRLWWVLFVLLFVILRWSCIIIIRSRSVIFILYFRLILSRFWSLIEKSWFLISLLYFFENLSLLFWKINQFILSGLFGLSSWKLGFFIYNNLTKLIHSYNLLCFLILQFKFG